MDMHIVNVVLPTLGRAFSAPLSDVQWTVIAYLLTLAVLIRASGCCRVTGSVGRMRSGSVRLVTSPGSCGSIAMTRRAGGM